MSVTPKFDIFLWKIREDDSQIIPPWTGDVTWPSSSVDGNIPVFDGITGKLLADRWIKLSDLKNITEVITNSQILEVNHTYITNWATKLELALPSTSNIWDTIEVQTLNTQWWKITQWANQIIYWSWTSTTLWATWYVETGHIPDIPTTKIWDSIRIICVVTNTQWEMQDVNGIIWFE